MSVADFEALAADAYSHIRLDLKRKGRPTGEVDMLIGAVAIANNAVLVTHNTKHFANIEGLTLEDWL